MDLPRFEEFFRIGAKELLSKNQDLSLTAVLRDGSDSNAMVAAMGAMAEECMAQLASVEEAHWLDTCPDARLDRLVWDRYEIVRKAASPGVTFLAFSTTAPAPSSFLIPAGTRVSASTGVTYLTIEDATFTLGSTGPVQVRARATIAGAASAVKSGTLTNLVTSIGGAPGDLAVTNPNASTGAQDREGPDDLRARARRFWRASRGGVRDAIEFGALSVPGCVKATAFEYLDATGRPNRMVGLVISDVFTDALVRQGADVPAYETQSQAFASVVAQSLDDWRAFGIQVDVVVAQVQIVPAVLRLRFRAGADAQLATQMARAAYVQTVNLLPPGETFEPDDFYRLLRSVPGLDVNDDELEVPAGAVVPDSPYQVLRTSLGAVTVSTQ